MILEFFAIFYLISVPYIIALLQERYDPSRRSIFIIQGRSTNRIWTGLRSLHLVSTEWGKKKILVLTYFFLDSLPQLAFDGMLKMTGVAIECLSDVDIILFLEQNIRGGVSFISRRYCEKSSGPWDPAAFTYPHSSAYCKLLYIGI